MSPFIIISDMRNFYPIQVIDLGYHTDDKRLEKENYWTNIEVLLMKLDCL